LLICVNLQNVIKRGHNGRLFIYADRLRKRCVGDINTIRTFDVVHVYSIGGITSRNMIKTSGVASTIGGNSLKIIAMAHSFRGGIVIVIFCPCSRYNNRRLQNSSAVRRAGHRLGHSINGGCQFPRWQSDKTHTIFWKKKKKSCNFEPNDLQLNYIFQPDKWEFKFK